MRQSTVNHWEPRSTLRHLAIAVPQLLYPELLISSAFFPKKKAPFAESQRARELWNCFN
jgi:hypothetical protein